MAKNQENNSEISFIREFEELKLKQKLLIEVLKKENKEDKKKILSELNQKLDFIVKIFQEANNPENQNNLEEADKELKEKLENIEKNIKDNFEIILEKINKLEVKIIEMKNIEKKTETIFPEKNESIENINENKTININTNDSSNNRNMNNKLLPPKPDFVISEKLNNEEKKNEEKKKWF